LKGIEKIKVPPAQKAGDFYCIKKQNKAFRKGINLYFCHPFKKGNREMAQSGSAPRLRSGGLEVN
jgi:hypothetical protein